MESKEWENMEIDKKVQLTKEAKNDIIGSFAEKNRYWNQGLLEVLLSNMDDLEMSQELLIDAYSIFVCYTSNFPESLAFFSSHEFFLDKVIDILNKAIELNEDARVIDLCLQIIRNLLVNDIIFHEHITKFGLLGIMENLVDSNKRINIIAQIISKLARKSDEIKDQILSNKIILDAMLNCVEAKCTDNLRVSVIDCLVNLSMNHKKMTHYIRKSINISKLINLIKYQNSELNSKVAYLATIMNSEKSIKGDFENLIKQIIFQITRMLQADDINDIVEGTSMLLNLVRDNNDGEDHSVGKKSLCIHACNIDTHDLLAKILEKYSDTYLYKLTSSPKPIEENKDVEMEAEDSKGAPQVLINKESGVDDTTGEFAKTKLVIMNILKTVQCLLNANIVCVKKLISAEIQTHLFKLLHAKVGDEIRISACECLRIMSRSKKIMKIKILEQDIDLESLFKDLISDRNIEIQKKGLTIICNFAIDFPGMVIRFTDFIPKMKEFIEQTNNADIKFYAVKILKNLLFGGHISDVKRDVEKAIFEVINVNDLVQLIDDEDKRVVEQIKMICPLFIPNKISQNNVPRDDSGSQERPIPLIDRIENEALRNRIQSLASEFDPRSNENVQRQDESKQDQ